MRHSRNLAVLFGVAGLMLSVYAHQAMTKDAKKTLAVLSTSDIIGYTTPCG